MDEKSEGCMAVLVSFHDLADETYKMAVEQNIV